MHNGISPLSFSDLFTHIQQITTSSESEVSTRRQRETLQNSVETRENKSGHPATGPGTRDKAQHLETHASLYTRQESRDAGPSQ